VTEGVFRVPLLPKYRTLSEERAGGVNVFLAPVSDDAADAEERGSPAPKTGVVRCITGAEERASPDWEGAFPLLSDAAEDTTPKPRLCEPREKPLSPLSLGEAIVAAQMAANVRRAVFVFFMKPPFLPHFGQEDQKLISEVSLEPSRGARQARPSASCPPRSDTTR